MPTSATNIISEKVDLLNKTIEKANSLHDFEKEAQIFCHEVKPLMATIRNSADYLEGIVEDGIWPLAKYREMMFIR